MGDILPRWAGVFPFNYADGHCCGQPGKTAKIEIAAPASASVRTAHRKMPIAIPAKNSYCPVCRQKISRNMQASTKNRSKKNRGLSPIKNLIVIKRGNEIMNIKIIVIALTVAVANLSGCALTTDRIDLHYSQQGGVMQIPGANNVFINVQVADKRPDKSKVSSKKNGFGIEFAPIVAVENVTITVRRAIEQELRARGFQVGSNADMVLIHADLVRFYNDHKIGMFAGDAVAELNMTVTVKSKKSDRLFTRQIVAQGIEPNTQLATGNNARLALNNALENGMKYLFEDQSFIAALLASAESKPT